MKEELNRADFLTKKNNVIVKTGEIVTDQINKGGLDNLLAEICQIYEESIKTFLTQGEGHGILMIESWYSFALEYAKEKGLDVSEYPVELNHLDYLLAN
jgi:hypothetical protein